MMRTLCLDKKNKCSQKGVTLIELVICIVILSISMVAVMKSFSVSIGHSADPMWRNKTLKLAQLYLDEILAQKYDDATPIGGSPPVSTPVCTGLGEESGEVRATYDDVDDYNGLSFLGPSSSPPTPPLGISGSLDSSYDNYSVNITVACDGSEVSASGNIHAKKITVVVTAPGQDPMTFAAYKANY